MCWFYENEASLTRRKLFKGHKNGYCQIMLKTEIEHNSFSFCLFLLWPRGKEHFLSPWGCLEYME
jgi:hypothetical protein